MMSSLQKCNSVVIFTDQRGGGRIKQSEQPLYLNNKQYEQYYETRGLLSRFGVVLSWDEKTLQLFVISLSKWLFSPTN